LHVQGDRKAMQPNGYAVLSGSAFKIYLIYLYLFLLCFLICSHSVLLIKHKILWKIQCLLSSFSDTLRKWISVKRWGRGGVLDCCGLSSGQYAGSCEYFNTSILQYFNKPSGPKNSVNFLTC